MEQILKQNKTKSHEEFEKLLSEDLGNRTFKEGEIVCESAEIEGSIKGNIHVSGLLSLKSTAKIEGDVTTQKLSIESGAVHNGHTSMSSSVKVETLITNG